MYKNKVRLLIGLLFCTLSVFSMDLTRIHHPGTIKADTELSIFDFEKEFKNGNPWRKIVPGSIMITPDAKGFVTAHHGQVRHCLFDDQKHKDLEVIIEHPSARKSFPMIAMAKKKDGSLLVVSAGNYTSSDKRRVAEYIVYCNGLFKVEKFDRPIQTISLDETGRRLAIAAESSVTVINLAEDQKDEIFFKGITGDEDWIVDIAIQKSGSSIVGVGNHNGVELMSIEERDDKLGESFIKKVENTDFIKRIYYPTAAEFLYSTENGRAKTIDIYHLVELDNDREVKGTHFAHSSHHDQVIADASNYIITAHWANHEKFADKIEVYRKNSNCIERFILEVPTITERYNYITEFGNKDSGKGHLLHVAIRGNCVIALATDGKMHSWSLPPKGMLYEITDQEKLCKKLAELKSAELRSLSAPFIPTASLTTASSSTKKSRVGSDERRKKGGDKDELKDRKKASSVVKLFIRSHEGTPSGRRSHEGSPVRRNSSKNSSGENTPRHNSLNDRIESVESLIAHAGNDEEKLSYNKDADKNYKKTI